ncbi:IS1595 family transposase [Chitinophaga skermanii]|nr:IS1595 family transposase [Chitinophaga skermanii]
MKNKYLKGAHLSERKFKEILKLFSEDLTATQIASISGVSRVTVNSYLKKIRLQIVRFCEAEMSVVALPSKPVAARQGVLQQGEADHAGLGKEMDRTVKPVIFGIYRSGSKVYTEILPDISRSMVQAVVRGRSILETIGTADRIRKFSGVVDLGQYRLYHLNHHQTDSQQRSITEDVDGFWALTKHRLAKFKGLNRNTAYLHLKECEFRYNNRTQDIYVVLLELLKNFPLNLS